MTDRPAPLTPAGSDLRRLPYFSLDVSRLRDSDLAALASAEEFRAAVLLWCAAWHQVPAASLPDEDRVLARIVGVTLTEWTALKTGAMRGFIACSDGRLYHAVLAEQASFALAAMEKRKSRATAGGLAKAASKAQAETPPSLDPASSSETAASSSQSACLDPASSSEKAANREEKREYSLRSYSAAAADASADPPDRQRVDWRTRIDQLLAELGPALNATSPAVLIGAELARLEAAGLDWADDIRPAVVAVARALASRGQLLRSYAHPAIAETAAATRRARLAPVELPSHVPTPTNRRPDRRPGPAATLALAAERGAFDHLDALPIATPAGRPSH
jgi:uncharacterized protein YdaU (DUF1376 family)